MPETDNIKLLQLHLRINYIDPFQTDAPSNFVVTGTALPATPAPTPEAKAKPGAESKSGQLSFKKPSA